MRIPNLVRAYTAVQNTLSKRFDTYAPVSGRSACNVLVCCNTVSRMVMWNQSIQKELTAAAMIRAAVLSSVRTESSAEAEKSPREPVRSGSLDAEGRDE
jgi:hypothetical protein